MANPTKPADPEGARQTGEEVSALAGRWTICAMLFVATTINYMDRQVLSILKLDEETKSIPVVTYTTEYESQDSADEETPEASDSEMFGTKPALWMN